VSLHNKYTRALTFENLCKMRGHEVVCLVRANNCTQALLRLESALLSARRWDPLWRARLRVVCGTLGPERFGVEEGEWNELAASTSLVIHCGATVHLKNDYHYHRAANVLGTLQVVRLAVESGARMVNVSTTDVITHAQQDGAAAKEEMATIDTVATLVEGKPPDSGYGASKAVAECLVDDAIRRGLIEGVTVRLGMVVADSRSGVCAPSDFVSRLLIGIAWTESFPHTSDRHTMVHSLPVDVTARAVVDVAESAASGCVHLVSGATLQTMAELRESLVAFGAPFHSLPLLPFKEWMERVRLDAALVLWPTLSWAAKGTEFPVFNQRKVVLSERCLQFVGPDTEMALRRGFDRPALHTMLRGLFSGV
jgi:thioester reductase-like protein